MNFLLYFQEPTVAAAVPVDANSITSAAKDFAAIAGEDNAKLVEDFLLQATAASSPGQVGNPAPLCPPFPC
jgi:hypothetical protein